MTRPRRQPEGRAVVLTRVEYDALRTAVTLVESLHPHALDGMQPTAITAPIRAVIRRWRDAERHRPVEPLNLTDPQIDAIRGAVALAEIEWGAEDDTEHRRRVATLNRAWDRLAAALAPRARRPRQETP